jgi:hypothetical protein
MYVYDLEVNPGDSVQIWRQIKNNGKLESGAFNYSLYLSSDANITTGDYLVGNYSYMSLGSYVTTSLNITATIPSTMPAGDYYWGLIVDAENTISENSESNNALTYGYVMRILACQSQQDDMGQGYDAPDWGASSYMGISVGSGTSCLDLDDYVDVFSITAGAHSRIELILQSPSGNDFELFLVDSTTGNDVSSYQTSNGREINMVSITSLTYYIIVYNEDEIGGDYNLIVNVVSLADVSVNLITIPNTVQVSSSFNVAISIDNYGSADTGSFAVDVLLSRNHLVDASDDILYTGQYSSIISGQQGQFNQNIQLDQGYDSGPYYLCISLNSGEAMDESRYTNNWKCKGIVVETPTPTVPTFINADESIVNDPSVRFEWNPSTSDGISISYYHIFVNGVMTSNISQEWVVITLDEGTSSVEVYAVNDVGTRGQSDSVEVIVDTVLPTAPILPNSALTIGLPGVLILEVPTCSDNVGVSTMEYSIDSVWVSFDSNELIFNLSSGLTTITFRCTDLAGNLGPSSSLEVTADLTPPNAPVVDGPDGWINSQSHTYTIVSESDEGTGIAWTVYSLDGGFWTRVVNDSITISLISGNHSIEFQSYDLAGNAGDITSFSLMVDEIGPNMPSIDLEPYYDSLTQISINVSTPEDFGSGYSYFTWSLDNGEISVENGSSIELGVLDEGKHVIFVTAWDEVGNPSTTARAWFNVDGTAPLAPDVECPNDWQTTSIIICSVEYTFDRGSGIKHLEVQIDNEDWNVISIVEGSIELSLSDGIHNVSFRWIDSSNHVSEISVQSISIDTIAPIIDVIQNGVIDQYVNDANSDVIFAKLSIVASDNGSGIAEIAYSFDSGETWKHVSSVDGIESPHGMQGEQVVDFRSSDWAGNEVVETFTIQFGGNDPDLIVEESKGAFGDTNSSLLYGGSIAVATLVLVMFLVSRRSKGKEFD